MTKQTTTPPERDGGAVGGSLGKTPPSSASKWREQYKVHPAADVFPMMSDEELKALGEDIKANGVKDHIAIWLNTRQADAKAVVRDHGFKYFDEVEAKLGYLLDGRNRMEAMERAGITPAPEVFSYFWADSDPVAYVISKNIHRRHLTKAQQADLIVAAHKASRKDCEVPKRHVKGKAGSAKDPIKEAVVKDAAAHGIGKRTVEQALAKAALTPEEIEARRQKFAEQAARRDERTRENQEYKAERKLKRESDVAEALAILETLGLDTAIRLVTLLMGDVVCCDVIIALHHKESERDEARSDLDDLLEAEAEQAS